VLQIQQQVCDLWFYRDKNLVIVYWSRSITAGVRFFRSRSPSDPNSVTDSEAVMSVKRVENRTADQYNRRYRAVAAAAIGMLVLLVALDLLLPVDSPSNFSTAAIGGENYGGSVHLANRVMKFSDCCDIPNEYSWYTGFGYRQTRTTSHPQIPYRSVKQSQYFETMPVLGSDGNYHESGYLPAGLK
jgi:hypothetical protein